MEELFNKYIADRNLKDSTRDLYKQTLALLYRKIVGNQNVSVRMTKTKELFTTLNPNMEWVMDIDIVDNAIKDYSLNNQKQVYNILAPLLTTVGTVESIKLGTIYRKKLFDIAIIIQNQTKKQTITKMKLKDNWVKFDDILMKYNEYVTNVGNGGICIDNTNRINTSFIALSIMMLFAPRRPSSISNIKVITTFPFPKVEDLDNDFNYILLTSQNNGKTKLVLNNYKTNKIYGRQTFDLNTRLTRLLLLYIKTREVPISDNSQYPFLLQKTVGNSISSLPFTSTGVTQLIKKFLTDELKIPNISSTDLRTIYITSWYNKKTRYITEIEQEAYKLGNSIEEFTKTYVKRDTEIK